MSMPTDDPRFRVLSDEDRTRMVDSRRAGLETELWQHEINRIGAADTSTFDARIAEIEAALEELDGKRPTPPQ